MGEAKQDPAEGHQLEDVRENRDAALDARDRFAFLARTGKLLLYGYDRPELEEAGNWPERVERLADESPLLPESQTSPTIGAG